MKSAGQCLAIGLLWLSACSPEPQLVDVGGHRLEVLVQGSGEPVVVLESGQGVGRAYWGHVQTGAAEFATVVSYSRSGYEQSENSSRSGALDTVEELRTLLLTLELGGPYVLVGQSLGGFYVRTFAAQHPEEVAGIVLVDATHEDEFSRYAEIWPDFWSRYDISIAEWVEEQPQPDMWYREEAFFLQVVRGRGLPEASPAPNVPLAVITAIQPDPSWLGGTPEGLRILRDVHTEWVRSSTRAMHLISDRTGHNVPVDEPNLVVDAIRWVVESIRTEADDT